MTFKKGFPTIFLVLTFLLFTFSYLSGSNSEALYHWSKSQYDNYYNQGKIQQQNGDFEQAIKYFTSALLTAKKSNNYSDECDAYLKIALMDWNLGRMDESIESYNAAQRIVEIHQLASKKEVCDISIKIYAEYNLAKELRDNGEFKEAEEIFSNAIKLSKEIGSLEHELKILRQFSFVYYDQNILPEFNSLNELALDIANKINHTKEKGNCLNNIGIYYDRIENYSKALITYEEASKIAQALNRNKQASDIKNNISIIYKKLGEFDKAIDYLQDVLQIDKEIGDEFRIAKALNNLGETYRRRGLSTDIDIDLDQALKYFSRALELSRRNEDKYTEIRILNNMGTIYADKQNHVDSLAYFNLAYNLATNSDDTEAIGMIQNNLGIVNYNQGNYTESTKYFQDAIDHALRIEDRKTLWEAYLELARAYTKQNLLNEALCNFKKSIDIIENIRSTIYLEELKATFLGTDKRIDAYQDLITLLYQLHLENPDQSYDEQAFTFLEKAKARAFLDQLEISQVKISQHVDFKLQNLEKEIEKDITNVLTKRYASDLSDDESEALDKELLTKEAELENLRREIRSKSPDYANLFNPEIVELETVQRSLLNSGTAYFEYSIGKKQSLAFVIIKDRFTIFELPNKDQIQELVVNYIKALSDKNNFDFQLGRELYQILVKPGLNEKISKLVIIADDILHYLPFETLLTETDNKSWLINNMQVAYSPSVSSLYEIIKRKKRNAEKRNFDLLAFGDPDFGSFEIEGNSGDNSHHDSNKGFSLYRLKHSGTEIEKISSLFNDSKINTFVRSRASKDELISQQLDKYKIIHFATHSQIDNKQPAHSYIALSMLDNSTEIGLLYASEIYNLSLNSDLVTLSACQTGLGKFIRGEGIEGLNRAFFYAGTSAVLMSLWTVNDQATYQLMERFYSHLRSSKSIMSSLREAKLEMIESDVLSHPFYWAGFIVSGNADQIVFPNQNYKIIYIGLFLALVAGFMFIFIKKRRSQSP